MDKVFVFKMSEVGPGSGVHLVKQMQARGDRECAWMMFDHVKRVKEWTTIVAHLSLRSARNTMGTRGTPE